jgi:hypothetical protein
MDATGPDAEHLRLLSIFHWILAGFVALLGLVPLFYGLFGLAMVGAGMSTGKPEAAPAVLFGGCFVVVALIGGLMAAGLVVLLALTGKYLAERRNYTFCQVTACCECLFQPLGTLLGIFTLVVLTRDTVRALFDRPGGEAASAAPPAA